MTPTLEERVEDYLDGFMSPREARAFEAALLDPEVARTLHEALALRSLLASLPPEDAPEGLTARIEAALGVAVRGRPAPARDADRVRLPRLRAALSGAAWAFRGPAHMAQSSGGDGLRTVGYASTPLSLLRREEQEQEEAPRPALWRRVLGFGA